MNSARRRHDAFKVSIRRKRLQAVMDQDKANHYNFFKQHKIKSGCPGPGCEEERHKQIRKMRRRARQIMKACAELDEHDLRALKKPLD